MPGLWRGGRLEGTCRRRPVLPHRSVVLNACGLCWRRRVLRMMTLATGTVGGQGAMVYRYPPTLGFRKPTNCRWPAVEFAGAHPARLQVHRPQDEGGRHLRRRLRIAHCLRRAVAAMPAALMLMRVPYWYWQAVRVAAVTTVKSVRQSPETSMIVEFTGLNHMTNTIANPQQRSTHIPGIRK